MIYDMPYFEVVNGSGYLWYVATRPADAEREARRIRKLHNQMPLAFPLPITVWSVRERGNTIFRKRISGVWERGARSKEIR